MTEDTEAATGPVRSRFRSDCERDSLFSCAHTDSSARCCLGSAGWRCYGWGWRRRCWRCPYGRGGGGGYGGGYGDGHLNKRDVADDKKAVDNEAGAAAEPVETDEMVEEPHDMAAECASTFPSIFGFCLNALRD